MLAGRIMVRNMKPKGNSVMDGLTATTTTTKQHTNRKKKKKKQQEYLVIVSFALISFGHSFSAASLSTNV